MEHVEQSTESVPLSNISPKWTIDSSDIKTVKVSNISKDASENDIKEFFSFSGDIRFVEMKKESEQTQSAHVTFKESQGADTATLLSGAVIAGQPVTIIPVKDYQLPPMALNLNSNKVQKVEEGVSMMLAKGFILGKDAINKAKAFDERVHFTSNASSTVDSIDRKVGLSEKLLMGTSIVNEKVREMDERFQVSEKAKSALSVAEQKATTAGSAIMSNRYMSTGVSWVSGALTAVAKAAGDVTSMTKEKVEKAEEEKRETLFWERTNKVNEFAQIHFDDPPSEEPAVVPLHSEDNKIASN